MNYPLISEYIDSIRSTEDNFDKLNNLRPVLDANSNPVMSSGNFAVVFKMTDGQKDYALKCFLRDQEGRDEAYKLITEELEYVSSSYLTNIWYYENELFVDSQNCQDTEFPVLLMDWVSGVPLDTYVRQHAGDDSALKMLAYRFSKLATWLLTQPFAHGDIKPDNILVKEDGGLVLVDYDGIFVPKMQGQKARELGSPDYRHPLRTENDFNEHIDDFALAVLSLTLKAISLDSSLLAHTGTTDRLLFSEKDYHNLSECKVLKSLLPLLYDEELARLYGLFLIVHSRKSLSAVSFRLLVLDKPAVEEYKEGELIVIPEGTTAIRNELFKNNKTVKCVRIPKGVKVIGESAFDGCSSLQSVVIPNSVTEIELGAFSDCSSLQSIVIPDSVTEIGCNAFSGCSSLQSVVIPDSVTEIGGCAFSDCSSLQSVVIPDSVTEIESGAFIGCSSLQSVVIPDSVTEIESDAFSGCSSLQSVVIPDSVTKIGYEAFRGCSSLQSIVIPDSVTEIGGCAFSGCSSLQSVVIPDSVTNIGICAFKDCSSLQSVVIPDSVTGIVNAIFANSNKNLSLDCSFLCIVNGMVLSNNGTCLNSCLNITDAVIPDSVTEIEIYAFYGCSSLQSIVIPDSVTKIGEEAFTRCSSLQSVVIPDSVTEIGKAIFANSNKNLSLDCSFLCIVNGMVLSNNGTCLNSCLNITDAIIPDGVTEIAGWAFSGCSSLQSVVIPDSVTEIAEGAFSRCSSLQSVVIPNGVTKIGWWAFEGCSSLQSVVIPDSVTEICDGTFGGCSSLQSVVIPNGVTKIGWWAFEGCSSLQSVVIPDSVTEIGPWAFDGCRSLQKIYVPRGFKERFESEDYFNLIEEKDI